MKTFDYTAVVWKEKEGYVSKCPELGVNRAGVKGMPLPIQEYYAGLYEYAEKASGGVVEFSAIIKNKSEGGDYNEAC